MYEIILRSRGPQTGSRDLSIISINLISHSPIKIKLNEKCTHFPNFLSHQKSNNKPQIRLHFLYCVIHILPFSHVELTKVELHFSDFSFTRKKGEKRNLIHFPNFVSHPKYQNKAQITLHFLYCVIHVLLFSHVELTKVELHFSDFPFTQFLCYFFIFLIF